jgi:hypothetical protein
MAVLVLRCPNFRGKLVPPLGCQEREELRLGLAAYTLL